MPASTIHLRLLYGGSVTAVDARSGRCFPRHTHEEFGIGVLTAGAQRSWSGRGPVEATCGDLIAVNPAETHDGAPIGPERSWSMLYLSPAKVGAVLADLSEGRHATRELQAPVVSDLRLAHLFAATRAAALTEGAEAVFDERLLMLLGLLFGAAAKPTLTSSRLVVARGRIDADPTAAHALADLASITGLSRFQTLRGFVRLTGLTPHAYLLQRRLDLARRLIRDGATLAGASAEAGFADQSHMHRLFVARYGFTPGAFAAAHRRSRNFVQARRASAS